MASEIFVFVVMLIKITALPVLFASKEDKKGYAVRCVVDGIFLGDAITHLIPGSAMYTGTQSDFMFYLFFAVGFAYFMIDSYKKWKDAK